MSQPTALRERPPAEGLEAVHFATVKDPAAGLTAFPRAQPKRKILSRSIRAIRETVRTSPKLIGAMMAEEERHGHYFLFVPVLIGSGAVFWFKLARDPSLPAMLGGFLIAAVLAFVVRHGFEALRLSAMAFVLFTSGMLLAHLETWRWSTTVLDSAVTTEISGLVERREIDAEGHWRYLVRLVDTQGPRITRPPERVMLLVRSRHVPFESGTGIRGRARLSPPSGPALPGLNDFAFSSYFDGIGAVGFSYGAPQQQQGVADPATSIQLAERWLFDLRSLIATRLRAGVPGDPGAFAAAIITDERRAISEATTEALRLSGLAHIVAISGLNMALAAGIFFVGVRTALSAFPTFAQRYPVKKIAATGALLMATAYYLISGFGVSAERAYIMMAVMLVAVLLDRPSITLRNIAIAALIIISLSPSEILGPSFQMSFAATVALVSGYSLWKERRRDAPQEGPLFRHPAMIPVGWSWNFVLGVFVTSLIGGVSSTIFSIDHFHRLTTYGLAANLAAMPVISFIVMPAGLAGMLLMPFGLEAPFLKLMGIGLEIVISIGHHVAGWGGDIEVGRQAPAFLALATTGFIVLALLRSKLRLAGIPLLLAALTLSWLHDAKPANLLVADDGATVAMVDEASVAINRTRPPGFIYDQWVRALLPEHVRLIKPDFNQHSSIEAENSQERGGTKTEHTKLPPEEVNAAKDAIIAAPMNRFTCLPKAWCAVKSGSGDIVAIVEDRRYAGAACDAADMIIAPSARFASCSSGAFMINGATLKKTGALEITLNHAAGRRQWTALAALAGVDRAWTRHRHYDWRSRNFDASLPEHIRRVLNDSGG